MDGSRGGWRYYWHGFPGAFREMLARAQRPGRWYWLPLTIWFYPFLAYIGLTLQAHDWSVEARERKEKTHGKAR